MLRITARMWQKQDFCEQFYVVSTAISWGFWRIRKGPA